MKKYQLVRCCYVRGFKSLLTHLLFLLISDYLLCSTAAQGIDFDSSNHCVTKPKNSLVTTTCKDINRIPENIDKDTQALDLENNKIYKLEDEEFKNVGLLHLQKIYLQNNIIKLIDRNAFHGLSNLVELDLSGNNLESIDPDIFTPLISLKKLKLGGNSLQRFVNSQTRMPPLPNLFTLDLKDCKLTSLHTGIFDNLSGLTTLDLSGNQIQRISVDVFQPLKLLNVLNLVSNPWKCDCNIRELHTWVVNRQLALNTVCDKSDKKWEHMTSNDFYCAPEIKYLRIHADKQTIEATDVTRAEGSEVTFECQVEADPPPHIIWKKDDDDLFDTSTSGDESNDKYTLSTVGSSPTWSNLTVKDLSAEDGGLYICQGANIGAKTEVKTLLSIFVAGAVGPGPKLSKNWLWILIGVLLFLVLLIALLLVVFCCFRRRVGTRKSQRVADREVEPSFEKKPVKEEINHAVSTPLLQQPDVVRAQENYVGTVGNIPDQTDGKVNAVRPVLPLIYGHQPRLLATPSYLSNSQILIPQQFDHNYGGWASYDPRRAPHNQISLNYQPPGPYGRLHSPFSGSVASFTSEPAPRVPPGLGYVTLPRRRRLPSWSPAPGYPGNQMPIPPSPTGSLPAFRMRYQPSGPRYDTIGRRTTADGGSNVSLNTIGRSQNPQISGRTPTGYTTPMTPSTPASGRIPRNAFTPMTPLSGRIPKPGSNQNYMTMPSTHFNFDPIQEIEAPATPIAAPTNDIWYDGGAVNNSNVPMHTYPQQNSSFDSNFGPKIPPMPPAKPKRKSMNLEEQDVPNIANIPGTEV